MKKINKIVLIVIVILLFACIIGLAVTGALINWIGYEYSALACLCMTVPGVILLMRVREQPPKAE